jgi:hypothetical protein
MRLPRAGLLLVLLALGAEPNSASASLSIQYSGQSGYTNDTRPLIQGTAWRDPIRQFQDLGVSPPSEASAALWVRLTFRRFFTCNWLA